MHRVWAILLLSIIIQWVKTFVVKIPVVRYSFSTWRYRTTCRWRASMMCYILMAWCYGNYGGYMCYIAYPFCYSELCLTTYLTGELIPRQFFLMRSIQPVDCTPQWSSQQSQKSRSQTCSGHQNENPVSDGYHARRHSRRRGARNLDIPPNERIYVDSN